MVSQALIEYAFPVEYEKIDYKEFVVHFVVHPNAHYATGWQAYMLTSRMTRKSACSESPHSKSRGFEGRESL